MPNKLAKIVVQHGGKLIISNTQLKAACIGGKWDGIEVTGVPSAVNCLTITNSFFKDADEPVKMNKAYGVLVEKTAFLGSGTGTAIRMEKGKSFEFKDNTFCRFDRGIITQKCIDSSLARIERNVFTGVGTCLEMFKDNHSVLDIKCNYFKYHDYAIKSDSTSLKSQGTVSGGTGNRYSSSSTLANNKLLHQNGNNPVYYYNPADSISGGMNVTLIAAQNNIQCHTSGGGSRISQPRVTETQKISPVDLVFTLIPNPNSGIVKIHYHARTPGKILMCVSDIQGKEVDRRLLSFSDSEIDLNYVSLPAGVYVVSVTDATGQSLHKKMIIAR